MRFSIYSIRHVLDLGIEIEPALYTAYSMRSDEHVFLLFLYYNKWKLNSAKLISRVLCVDYIPFLLKELIAHVDTVTSALHKNKLDISLNYLVRIPDDEYNLKAFDPEGFLFFKVPLYQLLDAFHVFLYGSYAETHPLYEQTKNQVGYLTHFKLDKEQVELELFEVLKDRLKMHNFILYHSAVGHEIAVEDCESASKKIKIN